MNMEVNTSFWQNNNNAHASEVAQASLSQLFIKNCRVVEISKFFLLYDHASKIYHWQVKHIKPE